MASTAGIGLICEQDYCEDMQTSAESANYGMCDGHYKGSLWYCDRCKSDEGYWCRHKDKADV
jgi:prepilin-type processing-associated H-X9-DG protein